MQNKPKIYIPAVATSKRDLSFSLEFLQPFREQGEDIGLMLIAPDGMEMFSAENIKIQYENIRSLLNHGEILNFIVMAPSIPEEINFLQKSGQSKKNIQKVIDFASSLPGIKNKPIVTFHLNTLFTPAEWEKLGATPQEKSVACEKLMKEIILPSLAELSEYAKSSGVLLKVETTPVPEFGDRNDSRLASLGNPFPLYSGRGFKEVRSAGIGIALDLCHTFTLFSILPEFEKNEAAAFNIYKGLFPEDLEKLGKGSLESELLALEDGDVVHLNDSIGYYDPARKLTHQEGVSLGKGEIGNLPSLIRNMSGRDLNIVFEINEVDYSTRPNLKNSLAYWWKYAYQR